jgi:hypothetical protein
MCGQIASGVEISTTSAAPELIGIGRGLTASYEMGSIISKSSWDNFGTAAGTELGAGRCKLLD